MRRLSVLSLVAFALPLAACETLGLSTPDPATVVDLGPVCPVTAVLSDATTVTKFRPGTPAGSRDPATVVFTAEMSQAMLLCDYDRQNNRLQVDVEFAVKATRGPAAQGAEPQLDFFVAIVDADNNVISKTVFHGQPEMRGRMTNTYTQSVDNFPVPLAMDKRPYDYEILTGFQLTPDELAYNRVPRSLPQPRPANR
jgi:hypothetical protein